MVNFTLGAFSHSRKMICKSAMSTQRQTLPQACFPFPRCTCQKRNCRVWWWCVELWIAWQCFPKHLHGVGLPPPRQESGRGSHHFILAILVSTLSCSTAEALVLLTAYLCLFFGEVPVAHLLVGSFILHLSRKSSLCVEDSNVCQISVLQVFSLNLCLAFLILWITSFKGQTF
jgi:hypothetical protein